MQHMGTRYELLAAGQEPRSFIDPVKAGAAFFDAQREEMPSLVRHDVYSRGGTRDVEHETVATTERAADGSLRHVLHDMPADVHRGYEKAAQRSPARVLPVEVAPLDGHAHAPPLELVAGEHFLLHRDGQAPLQFSNAQQAGAAFYAASIESAPQLLHVQLGHEARQVGSTVSTVGVHTSFGLYAHPHKALSNELLIDASVRQGYFSALEQSVITGLHVTDWKAATGGKPDTLPQLDQRLYADLQALTMNHRELALQAWADHVPPDVRRPTFVDLSTGQIATLDKVADMSLVPKVQQYVYGNAHVLVPPLDAEAARLAPPHAAQQMPPEWRSSALAPQPMTAAKGIAVTEKQPAPEQAPPAAAVDSLHLGGEPVARITFAKRNTAPGQTYDVRAFNADGKLLEEHRSLPAEVLQEKIGERAAQVVRERSGRTGTATAEQINAAVPARSHEAQEVVNSIEPLTERVQQQAPQAQPQVQGLQTAVQQAAQATEQAAAAAPAPAPAQRWAATRFARLLQRDQQQAATQPQQATAPAQAAPEPAAAPTKEDRRQQLMNALYERFDVRGNAFYFKGETGRVAFTDHGKQLSSKTDIPAVVRAMADMAQAKGWEGIRINGTPEFKRSVWLEASLRGIDVQGHTPTAEDRKRLTQAQAQQQAAKEKQGPQQAAAKQPERSGNTMEQAAPAQGSAQQAAQQSQAPAVDVKREQAMNAMRSYLDTQKLDAATVADAMKEWGAHIDKAIAQGKAVPTVQVYDPAVARTAAPTQAVVPQVATQERAAPTR